MANNLRDWMKSIGQNFLAAALLALVPGGVVTWLAHVQSLWTVPALEGLGAMLLASGSIVAIRATASLPPKRIMPSSENIEECVRLWLDNYKVAVKIDPHPDTYFRFQITLDSGVKLTVSRSKADYPDYVQILCGMGMRGDDKKVLSLFSDDEVTQILLDIKMELARAKVAYGGLINPPEDFHIFRRVPIHHNLTEFAFMSMIGDVEAAHNLVVLTYLKTKHQGDQKRLSAQPTVPEAGEGRSEEKHRASAVLPGKA